MSSVLASDLFAFVTTDRLTKIRQHLDRRFIVRGATSVNKLLRLAKPFLRLLDHFLHPILPFMFLFISVSFESGVDSGPTRMNSPGGPIRISRMMAEPRSENAAKHATAAHDQVPMDFPIAVLTVHDSLAARSGRVTGNGRPARVDMALAVAPYGPGRRRIVCCYLSGFICGRRVPLATENECARLARLEQGGPNYSFPRGFGRVGCCWLRIRASRAFGTIHLCAPSEPRAPNGSPAFAGKR